MLGSNWRPSHIENEIYSIMEDYEIGTDIYEEGATDAIVSYLGTVSRSLEWKFACSPYPDMSGGVCAISWIEDGYIHMVMFDYKKSSTSFE